MSKKVKVILAVILCVVVFAGGCTAGFLLDNGEQNRKLAAMQMLVDQYYLGETEEIEFEEGVYRGFMEQLGDPYSVYYTEEEYVDLKTNKKDKFLKDLLDVIKPGDILIMMSDGIYDGPKYVENFDFWMRRKIQEIETMDTQAIADLILEEVIRTTGQIEDDMTIIVTKIDHNTPKWASIPITKIRSTARS